MQTDVLFLAVVLLLRYKFCSKNHILAIKTTHMKKIPNTTIKTLSEVFEAHAHTTENGIEF